MAQTSRRISERKSNMAAALQRTQPPPASRAVRGGKYRWAPLHGVGQGVKEGVHGGDGVTDTCTSRMCVNRANVRNAATTKRAGERSGGGGPGGGRSS